MGTSERHRVVFLDRSTVEATFRSPSFPHQWIEHHHTHSGEIVDRLSGATIAITNKVPLSAETLELLPDLRFIAIAATGIDVVDLDRCRAQGIAVSNIRHYAKSS